MFIPNRDQILLLKAAILSEVPAQEAWKLWIKRVDFEKADHASHSLLPLVFRNPAFANFQDPFFSRCQGIYRQTWVANQLLWKKILPILTQLLEAGVDKIILLKGMAMIHYYYRDFGMRVIGDIDILIPKKQLPLIDPILRDSKWRQNVSRFDLKNREHLNRWHSLNLIHPEGMNLDLHWSFIQENSSLLDESVIQNCIPIDRFYIPSPTHLLLQTSIHGVKYSPIPLIRWITDAMKILNHSGPQIDWEQLVELAKGARVSLPLSSALQFLKQTFEAPIPEAVIQNLKQIPSSRLEYLEYHCHTHGYRDTAYWFRYCLNHRYMSLKNQILHLHKYLQISARLPSAWLIPLFGVYWVFKRFYRKVRSNDKHL
jgi:hypothetical protein